MKVLGENFVGGQVAFACPILFAHLHRTLNKEPRGPARWSVSPKNFAANFKETDRRRLQLATCNQFVLPRSWAKTPLKPPKTPFKSHP